MSNHKKTHFLVPNWDIPPAAIALGSLIADPTEPHRPLSLAAPLQPDSDAILHAEAAAQTPKIDTQVYKTTFAPYTTTLSASKTNSFSLTAQLSLIFGIGGRSSVSFATDNITSYHFRSLESEWFTPSATFITAMVSQPDVAGTLAMLSTRKPLYMITGVRKGAGISASSSMGKQKTVGGEINADAAAVGVPLNVGIGAERGRGEGGSVEWECEGPIAFSYQLAVLKRKKGTWVREEYVKGALMGIENRKDLVEEDGGDIVENLDEDEVEVKDDGWDDLAGEECRVVAPRSEH